MEKGVSLKPIRNEDAASYLGIVNQVRSDTYGAAVTVEEVEAELAKGPAYFVMKDEAPAGLVSYVRENESSAYISEVAVVPAQQGQGIGKQAMLRVLEELKNIPRIWLMTHPENKAAVGLYEGLGFKQTGELREIPGMGPRIVLERVEPTT